ncbi:MAG: protein phosphatase 2C domain-containing protein, partial [Chloroflexi bacterium]|nr:protein phosphatase 2C domain-containing protein [Chloroflexota bacterium]
MDDPRMQIVGLSDLGKVRENQEDSWVVREPATGSERRQSGRLLVVADGIGGSRAGEVASGLAAGAIPDTYFAASGTPRARLRAAVQEANHCILEGAETTPQNRGMGTTVVAAVIHGDRLVVAWVGDSRAYLVRDRALLCLTRDHRGSNLGAIGASGGGLSRWLGMAIAVDPDIREILLHPGDRILLCTDGLHGVVREDDILRSSGSSASSWASSLVQLALKQGAPDNVTVICAQIDRLPFAPHRHPALSPGAPLDNLELLEQVGADSIHVWYLARRRSAIRLVCALRPELQSDTGLILDLEADEESLTRVHGPSIAAIEGADIEKSLAYVCLRLPWQDNDTAEDARADND